MKTAFINLPYAKKIMRRYTCVYHATNFLFPPIELMYLAGIVKEWKKEEALIIDAIAEGLNMDGLIKKLKNFNSKILIFLIGIETIDSDLEHVRLLKQELPDAKIICFGYLLTLCPTEILKKASFIDYIILDEPEEPFSLLYDRIKKNDINREVLPSVAYRSGNEAIVSRQNLRIENLDSLPYPARGLINNNLYNEYYAQRPFATMQTSRGCPYFCNYCVKTFGNKLRSRSIKSLLNEVRQIIGKFNAKTIRFMDDNFCIDKERVSIFCDNIIKEKMRFRWSCLSRADNLNSEILCKMKQAGCFRIYLGIESFSERLQKCWQKNYSREQAMSCISFIKNAGIEVFGFFMVGDMQSKEEFENDMKFAIKSGLDYITVSRIIPYPGTSFFDKVKGNIKFSVYPYKNRLKDSEKEVGIYEREKAFYKNFYFRQEYFTKNFKNFFVYPKDTLAAVKSFLKFSNDKTNLSDARNDFI